MYLLQASTQDPGASAEAWLLGGLSLVGAGIFAWARKRKEGLDQPTLWYALLPIPLFALFTWGVVALFSSPAIALQAYDFLALQIIALGLGIAHVIFFYKEVGGWRALDWPVRTRSWSWPHFGFTAVLVLSGCIGVLVAGLIPFMHVERSWQYFPALLTFLVPFIWVKALDSYLDIPVAVYRPWFYTLEYFNYETHPKFPKATINIVLDEENTGNVEDVPFDPNKPFENLYRWVLHTYLQDQPDTYSTERDGTNYVWGWHFHRQRSSWFRWNKRIDPKRTLKQNRLRNGDTIIALRDPKLEVLEVVRSQQRGPKNPEA
jgi:hypothetical protein